MPAPAPIITPATGGTPQDSVLTRGFLRVNAGAGSKLLLLATIRQVFNNFSSTGTLLDQAEGAYAVPLVGGRSIVFRGAHLRRPAIARRA